MKMVGVIFLEGPNCVWELALGQDDNKMLQCIGCRDAHSREEPAERPTMAQLRDAVELGAWWEQNKEVITECKVSRGPSSLETN